MLNKEVQEKFNKLKNNGNYEGILQLIKNHGKNAPPTARAANRLLHKNLIQKHAEISRRMKRAASRLIHKQFTSTINEMSPRLLAARGVEIRAGRKNASGTIHEIELVKDGKFIAGLEVSIEIAWVKYTPYVTINLESGYTVSNYSKTGPLRPVNGPGYGTMLRALVVDAAKKLGYAHAYQGSAIVSNENNVKFTRGEITRPVSAWIMNKLGFNINRVFREPGETKIHSENRSLALKNRNTPKLNAVVREIFNKNALRTRQAYSPSS